jgi:hypothetical protein
VGGIASQEQPTVAQRLDDETAQRPQCFFSREGPVTRSPVTSAGQAAPEFFPEAVVGPFHEVLVGPAFAGNSGYESASAANTRAKPRSWLM